MRALVFPLFQELESFKASDNKPYTVKKKKKKCSYVYKAICKLDSVWE